MRKVLHDRRLKKVALLRDAFIGPNSLRKPQLEGKDGTA
jgi:hypothetical protein